MISLDIEPFYFSLYDLILGAAFEYRCHREKSRSDKHDHCQMSLHYVDRDDGWLSSFSPLTPSQLKRQYVTDRVGQPGIDLRLDGSGRGSQRKFSDTKNKHTTTYLPSLSNDRTLLVSNRGAVLIHAGVGSRFHGLTLRAGIVRAWICVRASWEACSGCTFSPAVL
jgi:hypothetical protein